MTDWRAGVLKWMLYGLLLTLVMILQLSVPLKLGGVRAFPVIPLAVLTALFEGPRGGGAFGLAAGLLCDAFIPPSEAFFAIVLMLACVAVGFSAERVFRRNFFTALLWALCVHAAVNLLYVCIFYIIPGRAGPGALLSTAVPEVLLTLVTVPPLYLLVRGVYRRFRVSRPLF